MKLSQSDILLLIAAIRTWIEQCKTAIDDPELSDEDYAEMANDLTAMEALLSRAESESLPGIKNEG